MNIKTKELKEFQKLSSNLKSNGILPIHDYLKFDKGKITKNIGQSFVQFNCEGIDETMLIDEKQLFNIVNETPSEFINITKKGKKVVISDNRGPLSIPLPTDEFPKIPEITGKKIELSENFSKNLKRASYFPLRTETIPTLKSFVMVGNKSICASDGFVAFYSQIEEDFTAVIDKETAAAISKMNLTGFSQAGNYYFFFSTGVVMGFSVHEVGYADMRKFFSTDKKKPDFTASSSDIMSFNSLAIKSVPKDCSCVMSAGKIRMDDSSYDVELEWPIDNLNPTGEFIYNPEQMNRLLTAIESEELEFIDGGKMYYIKPMDGEFDTLIMKLSKSVTQ